MKNHGVEPPLPGHTDEDAFPWVVESLEECLPAAEKCGVVLGLENHWGLARTPEGLLRVVNAVNSPWLASRLIRQFPGRPLRAAGKDCVPRDLRSRQDLLRRRRVVHAQT